MSDRVVPNGLEKAFCKSWEDWDEVDIMSLMFYNIEPVDGMCPEGAVDMVLDGSNCVATFYDKHGTVVGEKKIKLVVDES